MASAKTKCAATFCLDKSNKELLPPLKASATVISSTRAASKDASVPPNDRYNSNPARAKLSLARQLFILRLYRQQKRLSARRCGSDPGATAECLAGSRPRARRTAGAASTHTRSPHARSPSPPRQQPSSAPPVPTPRPTPSRPRSAQSTCRHRQSVVCTSLIHTVGQATNLCRPSVIASVLWIRPHRAAHRTAQRGGARRQKDDLLHR